MKCLVLIASGGSGVVSYGKTGPEETMIQSRKDSPEDRELKTTDVSIASMGRLAVIDSRNFLRECIQYRLNAAFARPIETYSDALDFETRQRATSIALVIISVSEANIQTAVDVIDSLSTIKPETPIVILSYENNTELARTLIGRGARAYIPVTMGFDIAIEAVRFVLAGGSYAPADLFFKPELSELPLQKHWPVFGTITARELAVARAIHQGKPNKVIAAEMHMAESTVKVHVRHLMKKLAAKNRTDVAIKTARLLST
jgi:DNA-binding NarL/FixJ family response regulator